MGRRHDWTLRPELMRPRAVLVSTWPTIADIPQGAVVLDTDGVVKQKVGDYLVPVPVTIIGSGPLASAPVANVDNLGAYYLETDDPLWPNGRLYTSRYNGVPTAKDTVAPSLNFNANLDFDLEILFRQDLDSAPYTGLFCQGQTTDSSRALWLESDGSARTYTAIFYSGSTKRTISAIPAITGKFVKLRVSRSSDTASAYINGVSAGTVNLSNFTINTPATTAICSKFGGERTIKGNIAKCSVACSTGRFTYEFNQSSGTTIPDTSGNGNTGTLTDASPIDFWKIGWTPVQW